MPKKVLLLDIGTTTISGAILEPGTDKILRYTTAINSQTVYGEDIITRIDFAIKSKANACTLQKAAVSSINSLIKRLIKDSNTKRADIKSVFCVSNTAMHHLFLSVDPKPLITPPYRAACTNAMAASAKELGLYLDDDVDVNLLPNIGGFVGSDALSCIIASNMHKEKKTKLILDIGTNGEVILGNRDKILAASTAAGPAFEGAHIDCGMPAVKGAIDRFKISKKGPVISVIGGGPPKGICGSGLIDAVANLLEAGIIDMSGKMERSEFTVYKSSRRNIVISQRDVRKIQLAKAAIYTAIRILMAKFNIGPAEIEEVFIAGTFGGAIDPKSVLRIGLIPEVEEGRIAVLKAATIQGLRAYLRDSRMKSNMKKLFCKIRHIPLFGRSFSQEFASALYMKAPVRSQARP